MHFFFFFFAVCRAPKANGSSQARDRRILNPLHKAGDWMGNDTETSQIINQCTTAQSLKIHFLREVFLKLPEK